MSAPTLRPARPDDAWRLAQIHVTSWRETYAGLLPGALLDRMTDAAMQERREQQWAGSTGQAERPVWVAEVGGEVAAFASGGPLRPHPAIAPVYTAELYTLYALRSTHGLGLGRALLSAVAGELAGQRHRALALWVLSSNPTWAFYRHLGGQELGEKVKATPHGELRETALGWADLGLLQRATLSP